MRLANGRLAAVVSLYDFFHLSLILELFENERGS